MPLNRKKAAALLEQAQLHLERQEWRKAAEVAQRVVSEADWPDASPLTMLAEGLKQDGKLAEAQAVLARAMAAFPNELELAARLGAVRLDQGFVAEAVSLFERARPKMKREPTFLTHYALALLRAGAVDKAEGELTVALLSGGGPDTKLMMALAKGYRGRFEEALALAEQVESSAKDERLVWAARAMRADAQLMLGQPEKALASWRAIESAGQIQGSSLAHMAYAAQAVGEHSLAFTLMQRREAQGAQAEDRLLFAHVMNLRHEPEQALAHLEAAATAPGDHHPGWDFELLAARLRSLRLLGRRAEAQQVLAQVMAFPEATMPRLGARVWVDAGHLAAEDGVFERADELFSKALALDPSEPEALRAKSLTTQRLAWREALTASAETRVEAARAEADAQARRFRSREGELEQLRLELERLKARTATAEEKARRAEDDAKLAAEKAKAEHEQQLKRELDARELEADEAAAKWLEAAFGAARSRCPESLWQVLLVAERTYQRAIFTDLPAAAVSVLYTGALERALVVLLVAEFGAWLDRTNRRRAFLDGAVRERRGKRVEYFDHFVEAFDTELDGRPPALGEVVRVLERRGESHLAPFSEFLADRYGVAEPFWGALATFIGWTKEHLRDPAAHGHGAEVTYPALKTFREQLLTRFADGQGALPTVIGSMK